jgi:cyclin C
MAANYWDSTQRKHWQFTKEQLASMRQRLEDEDPGELRPAAVEASEHLLQPT